MTPFRLTLKAKNDLKNIAIYTEAEWGKEQRNLYLKDFDNTFRKLSETPDIGKSCDFVKQGYKKFPQGSHIIFYKYGETSRIEIIRILHKKMDTDKHFESKSSF